MQPSRFAAFGLLAAAVWGGLGYVACVRHNPVVSTGMQIQAVVHDGRMAPVVVTIPAGLRGPFDLAPTDVRCVRTGSAENALIRCERGGVWASTTARCEPYEVGYFNRDYGLTLGAPGRPTVEIIVRCTYKRG